MGYQVNKMSHPKTAVLQPTSTDNTEYYVLLKRASQSVRRALDAASPEVLARLAQQVFDFNGALLLLDTLAARMTALSDEQWDGILGSLQQNPLYDSVHPYELQAYVGRLRQLRKGSDPSRPAAKDGGAGMHNPRRLAPAA